MVKSLTATYPIWNSMVQRCTNPKRKDYERYGGRGITVCTPWLIFENFLADMGERPDGLTIDRIDSDKGYEPGNCKWSTSKEQANNRSTNRSVTYNGVTKTLATWAEEFNLCPKVLRYRLTIWTTHKAMTHPVRCYIKK